MSLDGIVAGDYGQVMEITFIDVDTDAATNISAYTSSQQIILTDPDGNEATKTAAFKTDGSDGIIEYTLADGDIDAGGNWFARGVVTSASAKLSSEEIRFLVLS
ncbi:hypothetical protein KC887_01145 [Candidatus Kaiserbacteria bacterium]|nr:hypothetical protein [Candidatus Kaiserbacteria bacterium]